MDTGEHPTAELIDAARAGDLEAWNRLDGRYRHAIALFMRGRVPQPARRRFDTEDMLQSALLSAFTQIDSFDYRGPGSFERWVRRLVLNRLNGRLREHFAAKRDARRDEGLEEVCEEPAADGRAQSPSELYARAETAARLVRLITELPRLEREVLELVVLDRASLERISEALGISVRQVRRYRQRSLESLRRRLRQGSGEADG